MGICLSMVLACSLTLPVYAGSATSCCSNFEFDEETEHLIIGKDIENNTIGNIVSIQKKIRLNLSRSEMMSHPLLIGHFKAARV